MAAVAHISGVRKAAILMMSVGDDLSRILFQNLQTNEVQVLVDEIAQTRDVPPQEQIQVLTEFYHLMESQQVMLQGGPEAAERMLTEAFGKERAEELMSQIYRRRERSHANLAALQRMDPTQLSKFLDGEHPQTVALVLAHLNAKRGSAVLMQLREDVRMEAVRRLAEMRQFSPEMAQKVAVILYKRMEALGENGRQSYSGFKAVADMLNGMEQSASRSILEQIEHQNPNLAIGIRNLMFTFDDLLTVAPHSIREIVSAADKRTLGLALKNADDNLFAHISQAMSSRAVAMLQEDMGAMGPVRGKDIAQAQQEILALARKLESEGRVVLKMEAEDVS